MDIKELINHPELLDRETLYELRSMLALYPYFQTARLLMLQNLFLLHDPTFDEELRRAAVYITDRKVLFQMVEAAHYKIAPQEKAVEKKMGTKEGDANRTISLIDNFLDSIPQDEEEKGKMHRRPTPADAAIDYVAYLMDCESENDSAPQPQMKGQSLIDNFIENEGGKITLNDDIDYPPQTEEESPNEEKTSDESYFTETLARIYIKQGRYEKALEIIKRLSANCPQKNLYFADQMRFLEKLIVNSKKINNKNKQ